MPDNAVDLLQHPFDKATQLAPAGQGWCGTTSDEYRAFVGPFGGTTAATLLRAVLDHAARAGDPVALTVNFCAPIAPGAFHIAVRQVRANRSSQHWSLELSQPDAGIVATATAVFAQRRSTWSHQPAQRPEAPPPETLAPYPDVEWITFAGQYEFRFVRGALELKAAPATIPDSALSHVWMSDRPRRRVDFLSLAAMADAFFARIFHVRGTIQPFGTVSMTTYFHVDAADLAAEDITTVLGVADAHTFHKSFADQTVELWSPSGRLLATSQQMAYFRA